MPDFSKLMNRPAGQAKKPPALVGGDYPGKITKWEMGESQQKHTPYVRYHCIPTEWPADATEEEKLDETGSPIDLSKKTLRMDFYLTEDALYRLDEMLRGIEVSLEGRTYEEAIPDAVGHDVLMVVVQRQAQDGSDNVFNDVREIKPLV